MSGKLYELAPIADLIVEDYVEGVRSDPESLLTAVGQLLNLIAHHSAEVEPVRKDFADALDRYRSFEVKTLDAAFGLEGARKGAKLAAHKFAHNEGYEIYCHVERLVREDGYSTKDSRMKDKYAFAEVAKLHPYGPDKIKALYYEVKRRIDKLD